MQLMNAFTCCLLLIFSSFVIGDDNTSTENNEITPKESIKNIDDTVRQALLRAIDKLEKQAAYSSEDDSLNNNNNDDEEPEFPARVVEISTTTSVPEEILEESTTPDVAPTVQFFTAAFDEKLSKEQPLISFIRKEKQLKHKIVATVNLGSPDALNGTASISPDKLQTTRSIASDRANEISSESKAEIQFQITKVKKKPVPTTTTTTTTATTTTTTTTPRPTHNEDGENIELVAKDDIKIQAAPLVTAFTVDLDERGAAKNVIPIVDRHSSTKKPDVSSKLGATIARLNVLPAGAVQPQKNTQFSRSEVLSQKVVPSVTADNHRPESDTKLQQSSGLPLVDNYLLERQRTLEQQIFQLQLQAKQQQEEIRRQLQILDQQRQQQNQQHQQQQQQLQLQLQQKQQQQLPTLEATLQTQSSSNNQQALNSGFTIRPSIEFIPTTSNSPNNFGFPSNLQQLPFTKPSNFNSDSNRNQFNSNDFVNTNNNAFGTNNNGNQVFVGNNRNPNAFELNGAQQQSFVQIQPSNQLPFIPNLSETLVQQPPELSPFQNLPQNNYQVFQNLPFVNGANNFLQPQDSNQKHHRSRQFRQDSQTGNLGLNQLTSSQNQNFYRQQLTSPISNELQNIAAAYQSGIRFDHSPELNIISKVLALNHGINPYTQENLRYQAGQAGF